MPRKYRKKYLRYKKKYRNYKRKGKGKTKPRVIRTGAYITSDKVQAKLTWTQSINASTVSGFVRTYAQNSLYDPDQDNLGGVSALGLYQWSQFYNRYRVYASKISVQARSLNTAQDVCMVVVPSITGPTLNYEDAIARPYSAHTMLPTFAAGYFKMLKSYISVRKLAGLSKATMQDQDLSAACNANPTKTTLWQIYFAAINDPTAALNVVYTVKLTYYAEFYDRKDIVHFQQSDIPGPNEHINAGPTGISSDFISGTTGLFII